jgi:hypothetical protein
MEIAYLVRSTNEISKLLEREIDPGLDTLTKATAIACNTFRRLMDDDDFFKEVRSLSEMRELYPSEIAHEISELGYNLCDLFDRGKRLLVESGIEEEAANSLLEKAREFKEYAKNWSAMRENDDKYQTEVSIQRFESNDTNKYNIKLQVKNLRNECCFIARGVERVGIIHKKKQLNKKRLLKMASALGGVIIIALSASSAAITLGLSTPASVVLGALGSALISDAISTDTFFE